MAWLENWPRPYYVKYDKIMSEVQGWFDVYKLPGDVYCIAEPQQAQEVNAFLVIGGERALLIDTGMGVKEIKPVVESLYDGEVIVANTHCHFDHTGNNYVFQPVYIFDNEVAIRTANNGLTNDDVGGEMDEELFQFGFPEGFTDEGYEVKPYTYKLMHEGDTFDLGGRTIQVIHIPGHSPDSVAFYDPDAKICFTGDLCYLGGIYTHFDNPTFGVSNIYDYRDSMFKLAELVPEDGHFYTSHNDLIMDHAKFVEIANAMQSVIDTEEGKGDLELDNGPVAKVHDYGEAKNQPHIYQFDGFSIFCKPGLK